MQDLAAEEVFDLVAKLESNQQTLDLIQTDIIPKAQRTLDLSIDEYATDSVTYVQLIANWRSVLRYRVTEANLQSQHGQLLASFARSVGQLEPIAASDYGQPAYEELPTPSSSIEDPATEDPSTESSRVDTTEQDPAADDDSSEAK